MWRSISGIALGLAALIIAAPSETKAEEFYPFAHYDNLLGQAAKLEKVLNVPSFTVEAHIKAREELKHVSRRRLVITEGRQFGDVPGIEATAENSFIVQPGNTFGRLDVTIINNVAGGR